MAGGSADMGADLTRLLQQLQKSVLDADRPMGLGASGAAAASDDYPSDIDAEEQDDEVVFEESELQDMMKEAAKVHVSRWTAGIGGGLGATLGASSGTGKNAGLGATTSTLPAAGAAAAVGGPPRRQLSKAHSATKEMLGAPTLLKQLEGVFTELDAISNAEAPTAAIPTSPQVCRRGRQKRKCRGSCFIFCENRRSILRALALSQQEASPRRKVTLFGSSKSGEKKRAIAKLQAQMQVLQGDRKGLAERVRKAGQTGGVALAMLREEWVSLQAQMQTTAKELDDAHDALSRHEAETLQLRTSMSGLRKQIEELKARPLVQAPTPAPVLPLSPQQQLLQLQQQGGAAQPSEALVVAASAEAEARLEQLESELDLAYGKIEALSLQQHTSMDRGTVLVRQLQGELKEAKNQLAARVKKVRGATKKKGGGGAFDDAISQTPTHCARTTTQYAELKERVRQLEEELEAAAGANEAIKHANDLRVAKM
jgi:hypothetical protein